MLESQEFLKKIYTFTHRCLCEEGQIPAFAVTVDAADQLQTHFSDADSDLIDVYHQASDAQNAGLCYGAAFVTGINFFDEHHRSVDAVAVLLFWQQQRKTILQPYQFHEGNIAYGRSSVLEGHEPQIIAAHGLLKV